MSDDRKYSRVYHDAVDDPRFADVWDSDANLALWVRLLVVADATWPAPAPIPRSAKARPLAALVAAGLVDLVGRDLYRLHGMNAERMKRSKQAAHAADVRWHSDGIADSIAIGNAPGNAELMPSKDKTSKDETRLDETSIAREGLPNLDEEAIRALEERTGRTWSQAGGKQLSEYDELIESHGLTNVCVAMDSLREGRTMTARQLVWGAMKILEPMPSTRVPADAPIPGKPRKVKVLEPWQEEFRAKVQAQYDAEGAIFKTETPA